ncbi:MAG: response regulator [Candidatus Omnitrophota bacterium]
MNQKKTVLIIEQDDNFANGLKRILEKEGFNVVSLYDFHYIKELCQDAIPDLAIINISASKEFGLNMLRRTKEIFPKLPIVAVSVYGNSFSRRELARLGADDFIAKPFYVNYLKCRIEKLAGASN